MRARTILVTLALCSFTHAAAVARMPSLHERQFDLRCKLYDRVVAVARAEPRLGAYPVTDAPSTPRTSSIESLSTFAR
jgi:hypothetical protein